MMGAGVGKNKPRAAPPAPANRGAPNGASQAAVVAASLRLPEVYGTGVSLPPLAAWQELVNSCMSYLYLLSSHPNHSDPAGAPLAALGVAPELLRLEHDGCLAVAVNVHACVDLRSVAIGQRMTDALRGGGLAPLLRRMVEATFTLLDAQWAELNRLRVQAGDLLRAAEAEGHVQDEAARVRMKHMREALASQRFRAEEIAGKLLELLQALLQASALHPLLMEELLAPALPVALESHVFRAWRDRWLCPAVRVTAASIMLVLLRTENAALFLARYDNGRLLHQFAEAGVAIIVENNSHSLDDSPALSDPSFRRRGEHDAEAEEEDEADAFSPAPLYSNTIVVLQQLLSSHVGGTSDELAIAVVKALLPHLEKILLDPAVLQRGCAFQWDTPEEHAAVLRGEPGAEARVAGALDVLQMLMQENCVVSSASLRAAVAKNLPRILKLVTQQALIDRFLLRHGCTMPEREENDDEGEESDGPAGAQEPSAAEGQAEGREGGQEGEGAEGAAEDDDEDDGEDQQEGVDGFAMDGDDDSTENALVNAINYPLQAVLFNLVAFFPRELLECVSQMQLQSLRTLWPFAAARTAAASASAPVPAAPQASSLLLLQLLRFKDLAHLARVARDDVEDEEEAEDEAEDDADAAQQAAPRAGEQGELPTLRARFSYAFLLRGLCGHMPLDPAFTVQIFEWLVEQVRLLTDFGVQVRNQGFDAAVKALLAAQDAPAAGEGEPKKKKKKVSGFKFLTVQQQVYINHTEGLAALYIQSVQHMLQSSLGGESSGALGPVQPLLSSAQIGNVFLPLLCACVNTSPLRTAARPPKPAVSGRNGSIASSLFGAAAGRTLPLVVGPLQTAALGCLAVVLSRSSILLAPPATAAAATAAGAGAFGALSPLDSTLDCVLRWVDVELRRVEEAQRKRIRGEDQDKGKKKKSMAAEKDALAQREPFDARLLPLLRVVAPLAPARCWPLVVRLCAAPAPVPAGAPADDAIQAHRRTPVAPLLPLLSWPFKFGKLGAGNAEDGAGDEDEDEEEEEEDEENLRVEFARFMWNKKDYTADDGCNFKTQELEFREPARRLRVRSALELLACCARLYGTEFHSALRSCWVGVPMDPSSLWPFSMPLGVWSSWRRFHRGDQKLIRALMDVLAAAPATWAPAAVGFAVPASANDVREWLADARTILPKFLPDNAGAVAAVQSISQACGSALWLGERVVESVLRKTIHGLQSACKKALRQPASSPVSASASAAVVPAPRGGSPAPPQSESSFASAASVFKPKSSFSMVVYPTLAMNVAALVRSISKGKLPVLRDEDSEGGESARETATNALSLALVFTAQLLRSELRLAPPVNGTPPPPPGHTLACMVISAAWPLWGQLLATEPGVAAGGVLSALATLFVLLDHSIRPNPKPKQLAEWVQQVHRAALRVLATPSSHAVSEAASALTTLACIQPAAALGESRQALQSALQNAESALRNWSMTDAECCKRASTVAALRAALSVVANPSSATSAAASFRFAIPDGLLIPVASGQLSSEQFFSVWLKACMSASSVDSDDDDEASAKLVAFAELPAAMAGPLRLAQEAELNDSRARKQRSIAFLRPRGIRIMESLPLCESVPECRPRREEEVYRRLATLFHLGELPHTRSHPAVNQRAVVLWMLQHDTVDDMGSLHRSLTSRELDYLHRPWVHWSRERFEDLTWVNEEMWFLCWMLRLLPDAVQYPPFMDVPPLPQNRMGMLNQVPLPVVAELKKLGTPASDAYIAANGGMHPVVAAARSCYPHRPDAGLLPTVAQLVDWSDVLYRYHWAAVDEASRGRQARAMMGPGMEQPMQFGNGAAGSPIDPAQHLNHLTVRCWRRALDWILWGQEWDAVSLNT